MIRQILNKIAVRTIVAPHERAFEIRDEKVEAILGPGVYWTLPFINRKTILVDDASKVHVGYPHMDVLADTQKQLVATHFVEADLGDQETALVYINDRLSDILMPSTRIFYWKGVADVRLVRIDVSENYRVEPDIARYIGRNERLKRTECAIKGLLGVDVGDRQVGMLYDSGVLMETLAPGYHLFWKFNRNLSARIVDKRWNLQEVSGQEILTRDRVSLRVNLSAAWRIIDPVLAEQSVHKIDDYVYRELQLALRKAVGTRTLDALLADKSILDSQIAEDVRARLAEIGIETGNTGVKDVILPGEMKDILNQVVMAEKTAQANNIRRREETASTRSLLNTAKLMTDNPLLVRLKELEALEKVTTNIDRITVYDGMDGIMKNLIRIAPEATD